MISVIICTYNRVTMLDIALKSLFSVHAPDEPWEVVVVNNNSTDATSAVVARWQADAPVPVISVLERRQGKSFALNRAVTTARGDILVFTDDDVSFDRSWLREIVRPFSDPAIIGVGGKIEPVWESEVPSWFIAHGDHRIVFPVVMFDRGTETQPLPTPPYGANMAFRREAFERVGGFREDLGPGAGTLVNAEDTEFGFRVLSSGARFMYAPHALVRHPVIRARATKRYFRRWYFGHGRSVSRVDGKPVGFPLWFGVPRYLYRNVVMDTLAAIRHMFDRDAFYWELTMYDTAGRWYECWKAWRMPPAPTPVVVERRQAGTRPLGES